MGCLNAWFTQTTFVTVDHTIRNSTPVRARNLLGHLPPRSGNRCFHPRTPVATPAEPTAYTRGRGTHIAGLAVTAGPLLFVYGPQCSPVESDVPSRVTQPPVPHEPWPAELRRVEHPDLSPVLFHFCARGQKPNDYIPEEIWRMSAPERLASILWEGRPRAFVTFSQGDPAVCFTEATRPGFEFLVTQLAYQPWGLIVDRDSVYRAGGGPIWYARPTEYEALVSDQRGVG